MRPMNSFAALIFFVIIGVSGGIVYWTYLATVNIESAWIAVVGFTIGLVVALAIKVAAQWERAVVLRLGKFRIVLVPSSVLDAMQLENIPGMKSWRNEWRVNETTQGLSQTEMLVAERRNERRFRHGEEFDVET